MGRPLHVEYRGALYHITSRGNERGDLPLLFQCYSGVGNVEVGRLSGGIHCTAVSKASGKW